MTCRLTVQGSSSAISGKCSGDFISRTTPNGVYIEVDGCTIDVKCQNGTCMRTIKCPDVEPKIFIHEWNKRYTFAFE